MTDFLAENVLAIGTTAAAIIRDAGGLLALHDHHDRTVALLTSESHPDLPWTQLPLGTDVVRSIRDTLLERLPDLIVLPDPNRHQRDAALLQNLFLLLQADADLAAKLAVTQVAVSCHDGSSIDLDSVRDRKAELLHLVGEEPRAGGEEHYRTVTPSEWRITPWSAYWSLFTTARIIALHEAPPVSVVVRTKDRPRLLQEAVSSIAATGYPAEVVIVNDGGQRLPTLDDVVVIEHALSRGRAAALNSGVRAATGTFIGFLDDDDLYYPEHLATLVDAAATGVGAPYTDAISAFYEQDGQLLRPGARLRLFEQDFDHALLAVDNYIPLPTLLLKKEDILAAGAFDESFDLFEDWEFLLRYAQHQSLRRVPRVTCEIRHIAGIGSATLERPEGSPAFADAKRRVWDKHGDLSHGELLPHGIHRLKQSTQEHFATAVEHAGRYHHALRDLRRLTRELNGAILAARQEHAIRRAADEREQAAAAAIATLRDQLVSAEQLAVQLRAGQEELRAGQEELRAGHQAQHDHIQRLHAEVGRLDATIQQIYASRTWRLHELVTRLKSLRWRG